MPEQDRPLSIEQAGNKLCADDKTKPAEIKAEAQKQDISTAMPEDRKKYLLYCISLLYRVDGDLMKGLPENIRTMYSGLEMAQMCKAFLTMKIHGVSAQMISKKTGIPMKAIEDFDFISMVAVKRAVAQAIERGIPILGNNG